MNKFYSLLSVFLIVTAAPSQIINFPDANFKAKLLQADVSNQIAKNLSGSYFRIDANNNNEIETSEALQVSFLNISSSEIASLTSISNFAGIVELSCSFNQLTVLDVSGLSGLKKLYCNGNLLTAIDVSMLNNLEVFNCSENLLTAINLTGLVNLQQVYLDSNPISSLTLNTNTNLTVVACSNCNLTSLDVTALTNLQKLDCNTNQLTVLNVAGLSNLNELVCYENQLTSLNLTGTTHLKRLNCASNHIPQANLIGLNNTLTYLNYSNNQLTSLNLSNFTNLEDLSCASNQLTALNLDNMSHLIYLSCGFNSLTELDLHDCTGLYTLACNNNQIHDLDCNNLPFLGVIYANYNDFHTLLIKNGKSQTPGGTSIAYNPNLSYVCIDSNEISLGNYILATYPTCSINSYCTLTPGGDFYTLAGNTRFDANNDGCDTTDMLFPHQKFTDVNGTTVQHYYANASGNYNIFVLPGTHTLSPVLENPGYFSVSPPALVLTFPGNPSPFNQNFCVAPNGIHNDLEINIIPYSIATPGFNPVYKLVFKNKGTHPQSGTISLAFDDTRSDFMSATPALASQATGLLTWNFNNLLPFEKRTITFKLHLNSPTSIPSLNSGDVLAYTSTINGATDETPSDNMATLQQTLTNSYDPNNKTCLEGTSVSTEMIGQYVHYVIRFENNGTANAYNVVVKDIIDTAKFDINSLVPLDASHSFETRISQNNTVEFVFENINLPFDDANNDGYVAFKIKTKPTLVAGNTFSNSASIYFDYNFPIVTNTATTVIQALANPDFEFDRYFSIAPNPVKNSLNIDTRHGMAVSSISIYNTLGQLLQTVSNPGPDIDVSGLKAGSYFIKVISDKGSSSGKFLKQ